MVLSRRKTDQLSGTKPGNAGTLLYTIFQRLQNDWMLRHMAQGQFVHIFLGKGNGTPIVIIGNLDAFEMTDGVLNIFPDPSPAKILPDSREMA